MKKVPTMLMVLCFVLAMIPPVWAEGNDQYTVLLIQSNNADGDTNFMDSSIGGGSHTVAAQGDVHHSTDQAIFGGSSLYFDGIGDYLRLPDSDDWHFSDENFTIDFWMYNENPNAYLYIMSQWKSGAGGTIETSWTISTSIHKTGRLGGRFSGLNPNELSALTRGLFTPRQIPCSLDYNQGSPKLAYSHHCTCHRI